jgi:hypothetical protein
MAAGDGLLPMQRPEIERAVSVAVRKEFSGVSLSFGIEGDDKKEVGTDFMHLRRWRKSVAQVQGYTVRAFISAIVGVLLGAIWLGAKAWLGK